MGVAETAYFGAGCFWGIEETYRQTPGVVGTAVGYMGGEVANPTYEQVCSGTTGHAEVVRVEFDPSKVSFAELLKIFFANHDPTQRNRQGPDIGTQYRSVVFCTDQSQIDETRAAMHAMGDGGTLGGRPIATTIEPHDPDGPGRFWIAEDYHQQFLAKRGRSSCRL